MTFRWIMLFSLLSCALNAADDLPARAAKLLESRCVACHGAAVKSSGLDLRSAASLKAGGSRGAAIVAGAPEKSRLYRYAAGLEQPSMPPGVKLPAEEVALLREWIAGGASLPENGIQKSAEAARSSLEDRPITAEERRYWAFVPPVRRETPAVKNSAWVRNPVDAFLLAAMESKGLQPSPEADARTLVRRAYLDLTGLPPTLEETRQYLEDRASGAWERLIDRLLASKHYGERWGRHWLDLVRYADSGGYEYDRDRMDAWRYRDYVVNAFNADKPYDRFVREQLAGDEIAPESAEALIATGYLRHGLEHNFKSELTRLDELDDLVVTTTTTFLGVTVGCARCHNHKFDPIPQKDYYRIQAVFYNTRPRDYPLASAEDQERFNAANTRVDGLQQPLRDAREKLLKPHRERLLEARRQALPEHFRVALATAPEKRTDGQRLNAIQVEKTLRVDEAEVVAAMTSSEQASYRDLSFQITELDRTRPKPLPAAMSVGEPCRDPAPSHFLIRGGAGQKGSVMEPGIVSVAWPAEFPFAAPPENANSSWRRRGFAEWVASPENPLTARVMVNRIWEHHFGDGIVRTPSNFGKTGARPSHPELLDWLATEFVRSGWSMKAMHRLMMTSSAYRMTTEPVAAGAAIDPDNHYWWRMPRQRLEGEIVRDSILAASGALNRTVGGPGIYPHIDPSLIATNQITWRGKPDYDPETFRRSIYVFSKRSIPLPLLDAFDKPDGMTPCPRRNRSTIAPQALMLMNNAFVLQQARYFAQRLQREAGTELAAQIRLAYQIALARTPSASEQARVTAFVQKRPGGLVDFAQALFNLNEFVYQP